MFTVMPSMNLKFPKNQPGYRNKCNLREQVACHLQPGKVLVTQPTQKPPDAGAFRGGTGPESFFPFKIN